MLRTRVAALALLASAAPVLAQQSGSMVVGAPPTNLLRTGTAVQLETLTELTTEGKHLRVGDRFELATVEPVTLNGQIAIPVGSRGVGEITSVRNKGMWGKSGGITAHVLYIEANGRQIRMSGSFDDRGKTGTGGVVAAAVLIPVAGFFVTGTSARIAPHSHVSGFLNEDVPVQFASDTLVGPAPMVVGDAPVVSPAAAAPVRAPVPASTAPVASPAVVSAAGAAPPPAAPPR